MFRVQLALNVSNIDTAVDFYSQLFGTEPAKRRPRYANFAIAHPPLKLVLMENPDATEKLNHLGVEVESAEEVVAASDRLQQSGLPVSQAQETTCCYAKQHKLWIQSPEGEAWEIYTVLADSKTFGTDHTPSTDQALSEKSAQPESSVCCA